MRTRTLLFFLMTIGDIAFAQCQYTNQTSDLGIGLVEFDNFNHLTPILEVFNNQELTDKFCTWNISDESKTAPFCAKYHKPDYGIVHMIVLDTLSNSYKVLVNESDVKYIPKTINYVFWSWNEYLILSHGIRRDLENKQFKNQPIRQLADESSKEIKLPNEHLELLCIMDVKGDWVKVKYDCFYNKDQNPNEGMPCSEYISDCKSSAIGWLKWRIGNKVTIDIFLMP